MSADLRYMSTSRLPSIAATADERLTVLPLSYAKCYTWRYMRAGLPGRRTDLWTATYYARGNTEETSP